MAFTATDDAASVLENFTQDISGLPGELCHLLEEVNAKDTALQQLRLQIHQRDLTIQGHVKKQGAAIKHPKEDQWHSEVMSAYDRAQALQEEKCALVNKASILLDRQVKRLDVKIRDLQLQGAVDDDEMLPTTLNPSHPANRIGPNSGAATGANTPRLPFGVSAAGSSMNVANAAMARMANNASFAGNMNAPVAGMQQHILQNSQRGSREMSAGAETKRRKLNQTLSIPLGSSGLARHSSLGPGTPKAGTPGASSRGGSVGPRSKKPGKKVAPHLQGNLRRQAKKGPGSKKKKARRLLAGKKGTPSSTGEDEESEDEEGSDEEAGSMPGKDGAGEEDEDVNMGEGEDGDDNKFYCFCNGPSHGAMIACDNEQCAREWFHYECVGLEHEPKGRWLCAECKKLPREKLKLAR